MSNNINNAPPIKKNLTGRTKPEEESKQKKKSKSQMKYIKTPDMITQVKPLYLNNLILPLNPHVSSLTPTNICNKLNEKEEPLLPPKEKEFENKKTLVLDLDETLVHSSFTPFEKNDIVLEVDFEGIMYNIYVLVRPSTREFIINLSKHFELVIFTASIPKYASPLLDILDKEKNIKHRLYREQCTFINGLYIKDLKRLNRPLKDLIIVDNSPLAFAFNEENGLPIKTWYDDYTDDELNKILPLLLFLSKVDDVRIYINNFVEENDIKYTEANDFINDYENEKNIELFINKEKNENRKDEQKNKDSNDIINNNNENSLFNDYKIITSNIKKNVNNKFCFNNIINNKNSGKINLSSQRILNKSDNEKNNINLIPIGKINPSKHRNSSTNNNNEDKSDIDNDKSKNLNIGILLRKQSGKKKNLFRINQKGIEPLFNIKANKINNENNKNNTKNSFYSPHINLKNLVLPFTNTTKNLLFPKSIFNNNFATNNKINMAPIHMTKNGLIENNSKIKYTNLLERMDKKVANNNFTFRNEDTIKISFSNSNNKELIPLGNNNNNNKNLNKYKFLQISKSNSINNILKFNNLSNNVNINKKFAKTPNKHLMNIFGKENNYNIGFNKRNEKANMLYNLIKGIGSPKHKGIKSVAYSANPHSMRNHLKKSKKN